jgi:hypothetical protein
MQKINFLPFILSFLLLSFSYSDNTSWISVKAKKTTLLVPAFMYEMPDLNDEADITYGYVEKVGEEVEELYVITLFETKKEIKSYKLGFEFDALTYWELAAESLVDGLTDVEVVNKNLQIQDLDGKKFVQSEIRAKFEDLGVVYNLAVYESKKAFYQVLTWTIESQHKKFKETMNTIVKSLKAK